MLLDLSPCSLVQASLIEPGQPATRDRSALMKTVVLINARCGKGGCLCGECVAGQWVEDAAREEVALLHN